ncbi:Hypothetical predicted protein [Podarcis lilfordi]|uniref:Uncharacterized protein n=1 Tax=Podarcis lilfordi TaxID=74358 RepID=A0AA35K4F4_9SAUR|nr:Hypothetical predicted protein [Podarcis lilfordi]
MLAGVLSRCHESTSLPQGQQLASEHEKATRCRPGVEFLPESLVKEATIWREWGFGPGHIGGTHCPKGM